MTQHYYSQNPDAAHNEKLWEFPLAGHKFKFYTDNGVFSKNTVDFGSRVLIEAFLADLNENPLPPGDFLDVGCGYGPIGLAVAKVSGRMLEMVDINQRGVELAQRNAEINQVKNVWIHASDVYEAVTGTSYSGILSNPPIRAGKKVVHEILTGAFPRLAIGGTLTVVIQKKQGAPSAEKKMLETFGNVAILTKEKGYFILQSKKLSAEI